LEVPILTTYHYKLRKRDGTQFTFNSNWERLANFEQFGNEMQNETAKRLLPRAIRDYNAGQAVDFGKFTVSREGLTYRGKVLPWSAFGGLQFGAGLMTVTKQGQWLTWAGVTTAKVPNLMVFQNLVNHAVSAAG
jgi:hypothetical protein